MQAEKELSEFHQQQEMVLTIGVFDGVHLGHKYLLSRLKEIAKEKSAETGVITFKRHPIEILNPKMALPYIISLNDKIKLLKAEGINNVITLTFDKELAAISATDFINLLQRYIKMCGLVIGSDFALGRNREGNLESLKQLGNKRGFFVIIVPPFKLDGETVSSTVIRQALADGDITKVVKLTGRSYSLKGRVISGTGLGRKIGYPTANLAIEPGWAIPTDGVYATFTHINGNVHQSMTSIGLRPTVGGRNRTVETYILDYKGNLYDQEVSIDIVDRLRDEKKFANVNELKEQIARDIKEGKDILSSRNHLIHSKD
jgi:riboflavin kinase / FMN adenylyltransferase